MQLVFVFYHLLEYHLHDYFVEKIGLCDVVWIVEYEANIQQFPNISLPGILIILRFETSVNFDKFFGP